MTSPQWLDFVRRLQSIAQVGLSYSEGVYDLERYEQIRQIAAEIAAMNTDSDAEMITTLFKEEKGYTTPKVDVRGIVFNPAGEMLLVKEASTQKWTLPGGWADVWDTPAQGVEREILEESGYETKAIKLLALYDRDNQGHSVHATSIYKAYFLCELTGGEAKTSHETSAVGFFAEDNLPEFDKGRTLEKHVHRFFEHYRNPDLPSDFD